MTYQSSTVLSGSGLSTSGCKTTTFGWSARPVRASEQYADYGFLAVLGLSQRLYVPFLPITWQAARGELGMGGQAEINQSRIDPHVSFAFKIFTNRHQDICGEIAQEMAVLRHPVVREHEHVVKLEGICWDFPEDDHVSPVLVFQKSHLGDLYQFVSSERFGHLSTEDRISLCIDVGIAIRDMHHNGKTGLFEADTG